MTESIFNKIPWKVILVWVVVVIACYNLLWEPADESLLVHIPHNHLVDAVVFIAMGAMVDDPMVDYSISSVRKLGKWKGDIYVVTDVPNCFSEAIRELQIQTIVVPKANSIIEIKTLKPKLMSLMPAHVNGLLYIDVDILVTKDLASFFRDLGNMVYLRQIEQNKIISPNHTADTFVIQPKFDFGAFLDAKGHYVGFCSGCEKWHSGVMWYRRGLGEECLRTWGDLLTSGKFTTDQAALDHAEKNLKKCPNYFSFPTRHLLFAKDYIGMALTSGHTFVHLTAAGRPEEQGYFYREIVVPRLRDALHPPLNPSKLLRRKVCGGNSGASGGTSIAASAMGALQDAPTPGLLPPPANTEAMAGGQAAQPTSAAATPALQAA